MRIERDSNSGLTIPFQTTICPCGSQVWNVQMIFDHDTKEPSFFFNDIECVLCGATADFPIPEKDDYESSY